MILGGTVYRLYSKTLLATLFDYNMVYLTSPRQHIVTLLNKTEPADIGFSFLIFDCELANAVQGITIRPVDLLPTLSHLPNLKHITSCYVIQV